MRSAPRGTTLVNTSYRMQRVTGQQRYATEIAQRLLVRDGYEEVAPAGWFSRSALRVWLWVFTALEARARGRLLLSMTARAPFLANRHVLVVHDLFVLTNPEWFSRKYVLSHAGLLRIQLKRAIAVVAVSQPVADQVRPMFPGPVVVAPNAPSAVFFRSAPTDSNALAARGLVDDGYLLAVGSMDPRKNLPLLARAYGAMGATERAALPLVIVGGGSAVFRDERIAWPSEVIDAGYVTDDELRGLYAGARAVVFPSLAEGFGLPLVEAAAAGARTLVVSDIPVFRWVCGDSATYFDPASASDVTAAIRRAAANPLPIAIDLTRFDWNTSADAIADLCGRLSQDNAAAEGAVHA